PVPFRDRAAARMFLGESPLAVAWLDDFEEEPDGLWPRFDADIMAGCLGALAAPRWREWEAVQAPSLAVYGGRGMFTNAQKDGFTGHRPGTRRVDVPLAGHEVHLEDFPAWLDALQGFLPSRRRADVTETELVGGVEKRDLVVEPYNTGWPALFEKQRHTIAEALKGANCSVEHIGSTSVPGLAAKSIIDILVTVDDITAEEDYLDPLLAAGYELRVREPGHRLVRTPGRDVHVHVLEHADPRAADYLLLRERLRANADDRELYARTKHALVAQDWPDMNAYANAKTDVIEAIKSRARAHAQDG
ncbi:MAG: GrpB family protein, partial [Specibacter sp.]